MFRLSKGHSNDMGFPFLMFTGIQLIEYGNYMTLILTGKFFALIFTFWKIFVFRNLFLAVNDHGVIVDRPIERLGPELVQYSAFRGSRHRLIGAPNYPWRLLPAFWAAKVERAVPIHIRILL